MPFWLRGVERKVSTNDIGDFVFPGMESGVYNLSISLSGFKRLEKQNINLSAGERLVLGVMRLEIGAVSEKVEVSAQSAILQTQSAERAGTITSSQVENLQILGRNVPSLVGLLSGVVMLGEPAGLDRATTFSAQGGRNNQNQVTIDGLPLDRSRQRLRVEASAEHGLGGRSPHPAEQLSGRVTATRPARTSK